MSKHNKWFPPQQQPKPTPAPPAPPLEPDQALVDNPTAAPEDLGNGIAVGQIWEDVIVPDRAVNVIQLQPGAKLLPLLVEGRFDDGTGHLCASFVGEACTKIRVDAEMLKTGRLRK
jgi:hypothetical protein